jgi:hypothetical protein
MKITREGILTIVIVLIAALVFTEAFGVTGIVKGIGNWNKQQRSEKEIALHNVGLSTALQSNVQQTLNAYALLRTGNDLLAEATRQKEVAQTALSAATTDAPNRETLQQNLNAATRRVERLTALGNKLDVGEFLNSVALLWSTAKSLKDNMAYSDAVRSVLNQSDSTFDALLQAMQSNSAGAAPATTVGSAVPSNTFERFVAAIEVIEAADATMGPAQKSALRCYKAVMGIISATYTWSKAATAPADDAEHPRVTIGWHLAIIRECAQNLGMLSTIQAQRFRDQ